MAAASTGTRTPRSKCPADVGAPESSARDGPQSHCALCPELRTHGVNRQKGHPHPQSPGTAAATWGPPAAQGRWNYWEKCSANCRLGRRGAEGQWVRAQPGASHSPRTHGRSTGPAPAPPRRPPAQRTNQERPCWRAENPRSGAICPGPSCRQAPQPQTLTPTVRLPATSSLNPQTTIYMQQRGSLRTVVQLPHS